MLTGCQKQGSHCRMTVKSCTLTNINTRNSKARTFWGHFLTNRIRLHHTSCLSKNVLSVSSKLVVLSLSEIYFMWVVKSFHVKFMYLYIKSVYKTLVDRRSRYISHFTLSLTHEVIMNWNACLVCQVCVSLFLILHILCCMDTFKECLVIVWVLYRGRSKDFWCLAYFGFCVAFSMVRPFFASGVQGDSGVWCIFSFIILFVGYAPYFVSFFRASSAIWIFRSREIL